MQQDPKKFQQAGSQGYNPNFSQYPNQQQQQINRQQPAATGGRGDEWDSFFSQESVKPNIPQQSQQIQQNIYPQKMSQNIPMNPSTANPIDRASQLLRSLNQSTDSNVNINRGPSNAIYQSNVVDNYQSSIPVTNTPQYHQQQNVVMKPQVGNMNVPQQGRGPQQVISSRYDAVTNDFPVQGQGQSQQQYNQTQSRYNNYQQNSQSNQSDYYSSSNDNLSPNQYGHQQQSIPQAQVSRTLLASQSQGPSGSQAMYSTNVSGGYNQVSNDLQGSYQSSQIRPSQQQQSIVQSQQGGYSQYGSGPNPVQSQVSVGNINNSYQQIPLQQQSLNVTSGNIYFLLFCNLNMNVYNKCNKNERKKGTVID